MFTTACDWICWRRCRSDQDNEEIVKRSKWEGTYSVSMPLAIFKLTRHCLSSDQDKVLQLEH